MSAKSTQPCCIKSARASTYNHYFFLLFRRGKFCVLRLCETANCDHRNRNCTFDLCYKIPVKTAMDQARRPHKFIVEVYHTGYMESIYTVFLFQVCSYCCCVLYALSSLEEMYEKAMSRSRRKQSSA